jgi:outer membrane protein assembly factor BamB
MILVAVVCVFLISTTLTVADDWPQFRGIQRSGVSDETGLAKKWSDASPKEVWRKPLGPGYSAVSIVGDRLYTLYAAEIDGQWKEVAVALSAKNGKELWRTPLGERFDNEFGNGPRATPTVSGDRVYVLDSTGTLAALKTRDGAIAWSMDFTKQFEIETPRFGFSTSVVVDGDQVIVQGGGTDGDNYIGINKHSGEIVWSRGSGPAGYTSALPVTVGGKKRYVYVAGGELVCIDEAGGEVWSHEWPKGETHAMPIHIPPDKLYVAGAEGVGARLFRIKEADGKGEVELLWEQPFMRNPFSSAVVHEGTIYGFDNATLKAISVEDGKMAWGKRGLGKGSLILADGHLLVLSDRGKLMLVEATPEAYKEKGSVQAMEGLCWTAPALADGRLYLRNHAELVVYDLR